MEVLKQLYNYDTQDAPMVMDIRSESVLPLSSGNRKYVFRLEPNGYLDENSLLLFKLKNNTANELRLNVLNGGLGAIKNVRFSVGDFILNDVNGVNEIATLEHLLTKSRAFQNSVLSQYLGNQFYTKVADTQQKDGAGLQRVGKGELVNDPELGGISLGGSDNASSASGAVDGKVAVVNSLKIKTNKFDNHQVAVPLGMIIPALRGRTIPLFLFDEYRIYITIEFHDASVFCYNMAKTDYSGNETLDAGASDVNEEDVKLQVDYIIEPAELVEQVKNKVKDGYAMNFYDIVRVESQLPSGTPNTTQRKEFKLGQNNREVHKIFMWRQFTDAPTNKRARSEALLGKQRCDGINKESVNYYINGQDKFPESEVFQNGFHYDQLGLALDVDLNVERPMFENSKDTQFAGLATRTNPLMGTMKPLGVDLRNGNPGIVGGGTSIGDYPILVKYAREPIADLDTSNSPDVMGTKGDDGAMNVNFYVLASRRAVITSGINRNDVVVSY